MVLMFLCMQEVSCIGRVWVCARTIGSGGRGVVGLAMDTAKRQQQQQSSAICELRKTRNDYGFRGRRRATDG